MSDRMPAVLVVLLEKRRPAVMVLSSKYVSLLIPSGTALKDVFSKGYSHHEVSLSAKR